MNLDNNSKYKVVHDYEKIFINFLQKITIFIFFMNFQKGSQSLKVFKDFKKIVNCFHEYEKIMIF